MRKAGFIVLPLTIFFLSGCWREALTIKPPLGSTASLAENSGSFSEVLASSPRIRNEVSNIFETSASECSKNNYLDKAGLVASDLLFKNLPKSPRPPKSVLEAECLVRSAVKSWDCSIVDKSRLFDCESLLVMKKAVSENADPFVKASNAEIYVRYYLDAKAYPPQTYLR